MSNINPESESFAVYNLYHFQNLSLKTVLTNRKTFWVKNQLADRSRSIIFTTFNSIPLSITQSEEGGMRDVMINKLTPLHHIVGIQFTGGIEIWDNANADQPGTRQLSCACCGHNFGSPYPIIILG